MSVDTTFKPLGPTTLIGATAVRLVDAPGNPAGISTVRVKCLVAGYFTWGSASVASAGAPTAGAPSANTIGMAVVGSVERFEIPAASVFFIASAPAAFEMTPGIGG